MVGRVLRNYGEERAAVSVPNDDNPAIFLLYGRVFSLLFIIIFFFFIITLTSCLVSLTVFLSYLFLRLILHYYCYSLSLLPSIALRCPNTYSMWNYYPILYLHITKPLKSLNVKLLLSVYIALVYNIIHIYIVYIKDFPIIKYLNP